MRYLKQPLCDAVDQVDFLKFIIHTFGFRDSLGESKYSLRLYSYLYK